MTDHFDGITMPFEASEPLNLKAENPGAKAEIDADVLQAIMEQAQVFASTWSLVGGRFDDGSKLRQSSDEKELLRGMISAAIRRPPTHASTKAIEGEQT